MATPTAEKAAESAEVPETPKVNLDKLAKSGNDPFLSKVWPDITTSLKELRKQSEDLKKFTPPTAPELMEFIKGEGKNDPAIRTAQEAVDKVKEELTKLYEQQNKRAKELMQKETLPAEELEKLRSDYSDKRTTVVNLMDAIKSYADVMEKYDMLAALDEVQIPRFTHGLGGTASGNTPPKNPEAVAIREWAKSNGITVPERGRIPQKVKDQYYQQKNTAGKE
jgi:hypothetical protein